MALVNETAARTYFAGANPIGRRFGTSHETAYQIEIVGVLRDTKYDSVRDPAPATFYVPFRQARLSSSMIFQVRTPGDPAAAVGATREAVRQVDATLPVMSLTTRTELIDRRLQQERTFAQACTLFGVLALTVVSVGLFG